MGDQRNRLTEPERLERRRKLINLVRDGRYTWDQIAEELGYDSKGTAHNDYTRTVEAERKEQSQGNQTMNDDHDNPTNTTLCNA